MGYHLFRLRDIANPLSPSGPDQDHPKPLLVGLSRLYRGLGVSAARSVITHGLLWTVLDHVSGWIDGLPPSPPDPALQMT